MAFRISRAERLELNSFSQRIAKEQADLAGVLEEQSAIIEAAYERINGALDTYNGALGDARSYVEDISSQAQSDFDDKSDRWQEGERGDAVREWIDAPDNAVVELEELEQFVYNIPSLDVGDHSELLDQLEDEPSY